MPNLSYEKMTRYANRALDLIEGPDLHPTLLATAPTVKQAVERFLTSYANLKDALTAVNKESTEANDAVQKLMRDFAAIRSTVAMCAPHETNIPYVSSVSNTPDDVLNAARELSSILDKHKEEDWASKILSAYEPLLEQVKKELSEILEVRMSIQKIRNETREAAGDLLKILTILRNILRNVYGRNSKEYHLMKPVYGHAGDQEEAPQEPESNPDPIPVPVPIA